MSPAARARKVAIVGKMKTRKPLRALKRLNPVRYLKNRRFPLRNFQMKVPVFQSSENFILKTAETTLEMRRVLKLRHDIFYKELQNKQTDNKLDLDELDAICDHLIIKDRKTKQIVGTYRMISSTFSDRFYSEGEFDLSGVLALEGNKLELGRACIHPDYRTGAIISLLWKGIAEYMKKTNTKYLFGCASVQTVDPLQASRILGYLRSKNLSTDELGVAPTENYRSQIVNLEPDATISKEIPALVQSYILAGAKFHGLPALDRDFDCYDFFMMLKTDEMSKLFKRRYKIED
jgi:putative hemolysin